MGEVYASHVASSWHDCSTLCLEEQEKCALFSFRAKDVNETGENCHLYRRISCNESDLDYDSSYDLVKFDENGKEILREMYLLIQSVYQIGCLSVFIKCDDNLLLKLCFLITKLISCQ